MLENNGFLFLIEPALNVDVHRETTQLENNVHT
jgi:hypothetical protein